MANGNLENTLRGIDVKSGFEAALAELDRLGATQTLPLDALRQFSEATFGQIETGDEAAMVPQVPVPPQVNPNATLLGLIATNIAGNITQNPNLALQAMSTVRNFEAARQDAIAQNAELDLKAQLARRKETMANLRQQATKEFDALVRAGHIDAATKRAATLAKIRSMERALAEESDQIQTSERVEGGIIEAGIRAEATKHGADTRGAGGKQGMTLTALAREERIISNDFTQEVPGLFNFLQGKTDTTVVIPKSAQERFKELYATAASVPSTDGADQAAANKLARIFFEQDKLTTEDELIDAFLSRGITNDEIIANAIDTVLRSPKKK